MGIDQYGETYHNLGKYPRKELLKRLGYKKADKMYRDKKDGSTIHCGYVIGKNWINLYEIKPIERRWWCQDNCVKFSSWRSGKFLRTFPTGLERQLSSIFKEIKANKV